MAKNLSNNVPVPGGHPSAVAARSAARGTRPTRRASSSRTRSRTTGWCGEPTASQDQNSLATGGTLTNDPMWNPVLAALLGTWHAPWESAAVGQLSAVIGRPGLGPIVDQLAANSPELAVFGPATVVSSTGVAPVESAGDADPLRTTRPAAKGRCKAPRRSHRQPQARPAVQARLAAGRSSWPPTSTTSSTAATTRSTRAAGPNRHLQPRQLPAPTRIRKRRGPLSSKRLFRF